MSEERLCEAYGEHQAYCPLHGYPIGKSVEELLAEAHAAAVAPLEKRIRTLERHLAAYEMDSAPSPVREPEGLDVERLFRVLWETNAYWRWANDKQHSQAKRFRDWATNIAAEYARLAPERPADEVDG